MKQTLLTVLFSCLVLCAFAQFSPDGSDASPFPQANLLEEQTQISIYPNPATHFISIDNDDNVKQIAVFNLMGRKLLSFQDVEKDVHYDVSNLPSGMYLIRIVDQSNKIVTTQRISKR